MFKGVAIYKDIKAVTTKQSLAKKHFGQNFLEDENVLNAIIQSIPKQNTDIELIEIGAGLGDLTNKLLGLGNITAYEVDKELIPCLQERFKDALEYGRLSLVIGDVLEFWKGESLHNRAYFLVSNLPYYIATLLVIKTIKDPLSKGCVVMTQKEVAQKFCAQCGESDFSALSVLAQSVGEATLLFDVPPSAFVPPPKVTSSVFLLQKVANPPNFRDLEYLESLLKVAFSAPRKTILNNLSKAYPKQAIIDALESLQITPSKRPHEIDTPNYHRLLKIL
ncbi:16S rRNA (adenine(1518)-N(6)/adenine(1519)-N(6))-dimethyltransferase RsmA [Helicobacter sp. Faydin-H64]|uniref:Ribosomal RNA small subunit methyltransferase A n=1 Tax=Helicobacter turcicus TaxID=2867412 RepID=A0ABS7JNX6_9HELI|nr:16S rRNA (adenine(1518)-N(6)/adenine(1519)-N(6))-dimethyltransferase RsmA [Helicobacter turcicus]MBX7545943.1 16S rRNA (adenine(1518)-N(6)/adenine(1519)-N(6))-dimethyltransferase RsmA [Helicobacter turcicus]